jgi:hypothetical protein
MGSFAHMGATVALHAVDCKFGRASVHRHFWPGSSDIRTVSAMPPASPIV